MDPLGESYAVSNSSESPGSAVLEFDDMPGTGKNEARAMRTLGGWGFTMLALGALCVAIAMMTVLSESAGGFVVFLWFAAVVCSVTGLFQLAAAVVCLGNHLENSYALQVAVARNLSQLEGFDVEGVHAEGGVSANEEIAHARSQPDE